MQRDGEEDKRFLLRVLGGLAEIADDLGDVEILQVGVRLGVTEADASVVYCDGRTWREVPSPAAQARVRDVIHRFERPQSPQTANNTQVPAATTEFAVVDDRSRNLTRTIRTVDEHLAVLRPARILDFGLRTSSAEAIAVIHYLARDSPEA
jgi:hypothetical protein